GLGMPNGQPQFQSLELLADQASPAQPEEGVSADDTAAQVLLRPGFSPETSAESVTAIGAEQATAGFFGSNGPGDFKDKFGNGFDATDAGAPGERDGFTGGGKTGGKAGKVDKNQIRGSIFQSFDASALDTAPFA